jgi:hypothetical protein
MQVWGGGEVSHGGGGEVSHGGGDEVDGRDLMKPPGPAPQAEGGLDDGHSALFHLSINNEEKCQFKDSFSRVFNSMICLNVDKNIRPGRKIS